MKLLSAFIAMEKFFERMAKRKEKKNAPERYIGIEAEVHLISSENVWHAYYSRTSN